MLSVKKHRCVHSLPWIAAGVVFGLIWPASTVAPQPPVYQLPPRVIATDPPLGATNVDATLTEIKVTFDQPMTTGQAWSWMMLAHHGMYPGQRGGAGPPFDATGRTCTLPVRLTANAVYAVGVNSFRHTGFKSAAGIPAVNFGWAFATGGYEAANLPPSVVSVEPANGATDVDPALAEIKVTFDRPMRTETWSWVKLDACGQFPGAAGGTPRFDGGARVCSLPVRLMPNTVYAVSINSFENTGFKDRNGAPALPYGWTFRTR